MTRYDAKMLLEKFRGKRLIFVGDSLNRNQWESMICLVHSASVPDRSSLTRNGSLSMFYMELNKIPNSRPCTKKGKQKLNCCLCRISTRPWSSTGLHSLSSRTPMTLPYTASLTASSYTSPSPSMPATGPLTTSSSTPTSGG